MGIHNSLILLPTPALHPLEVWFPVLRRTRKYLALGIPSSVWHLCVAARRCRRARRGGRCGLLGLSVVGGAGCRLNWEGFGKAACLVRAGCEGVGEGRLFYWSCHLGVVQDLLIFLLLIVCFVRVLFWCACLGLSSFDRILE